MSAMRAYSYDAVGRDGRTYSVRVLLTDEELEGLHLAGLLPAVVDPVMATSAADDALDAAYEQELHLLSGGSVS